MRPTLGRAVLVHVLQGAQSRLAGINGIHLPRHVVYVSGGLWCAKLYVVCTIAHVHIHVHVWIRLLCVTFSPRGQQWATRVCNPGSALDSSLASMCAWSQTFISSLFVDVLSFPQSLSMYPYHVRSISYASLVHDAGEEGPLR
jgi:hypothetical protein